MAMEINTQEIRQLAKDIEKISTDVTEIDDISLTRARRCMDGSFEGMAADAMAQALEEISGSLKKLGTSLGHASKEMMAYADKLELLDKEIAAEIQNR